MRAPPDSARLLLPRAAWGRVRPRVPHPRWLGGGRGGRKRPGLESFWSPALQRSPTARLCPTCGVPNVQNCVHTSPLSSLQVSRSAGRLCAPRARTTNPRLASCLSLLSLTSAPARPRLHLGGRAVPNHPRRVPQHPTLLKTRTQRPRKTCFTRDSRRLQLLAAEISHPLCLSLPLLATAPSPASSLD